MLFSVISEEGTRYALAVASGQGDLGSLEAALVQCSYQAPAFGLSTVLLDLTAFELKVEEPDMFTYFAAAAAAAVRELDLLAICGDAAVEKAFQGLLTVAGPERVCFVDSVKKASDWLESNQD